MKYALVIIFSLAACSGVRFSSMRYTGIPVEDYRLAYDEAISELVRAQNVLNQNPPELFSASGFVEGCLTYVNKMAELADAPYSSAAESIAADLRMMSADFRVGVAMDAMNRVQAAERKIRNELNPNSVKVKTPGSLPTTQQVTDNGTKSAPVNPEIAHRALMGFLSDLRARISEKAAETARTYANALETLVSLKDSLKDDSEKSRAEAAKNLLQSISQKTNNFGQFPDDVAPLLGELDSVTEIVKSLKTN